MAKRRSELTPEERWRRRRNDSIALVVILTFSCAIFCAGQADQGIANRRAEATQAAIEDAWTPTPAPPTQTPAPITAIPNQLPTATPAPLNTIEALTDVLEDEIDVQLLTVRQSNDLIVVTFVVPSLFPILATQSTFEIVLEEMQGYRGNYEQLQITGVILEVNQSGVIIERPGASAQYRRSTIEAINRVSFNSDDVYSEEYVLPGSLFLADDMASDEITIVIE